MQNRIEELARKARALATTKDAFEEYDVYFDAEKFEHVFAELIAKDCIHYIETHRIPVGSSAAGEMACEWTYDALKSIRDEIKEHFEIKD